MVYRRKMKTTTAVATTSSPVPDSDSDEEISPLRCWDCNVNFTSKHFLYNHLFHHIKQPVVRLDRVQLPPLKITLKNRSGNSFEIVQSPTEEKTSLSRNTSLTGNLEDNKDDIEKLLGFEGETAVNSEPEQPIAEQPIAPEEESDPLGGAHFDGAQFEEGLVQEPEGDQAEEEEEEDNKTNVRFSPNFANVERIDSPAASESSNTSEKATDNTAGVDVLNANNTPEYGNIPGAEPTPPPEPSPEISEYPKIKIKTTGLFKDPPSDRLTITEITDDNPNGDPTSNHNGHNMWTTPSLEDPLKLPDSDDNLLSLFNNNDRAKDLGFSTSENEFISLDRFDERNRGAMQLYNPNNNQSQNPLDSLTGLPMQALAQQVSRLQPSSGNGMHQQNVLINIQQFPSGPPQPSYQPPPMYHYPPHPGQPMHQPYQYQPPNPMYYPPAPGYPPQHPMPPPPPQMGQLGQPPMNQQQMGQPPQMGHQPPMNQPQNQMVPSSQAQQNHQMQQPQPYRQPMPPRQPAPRQPGTPGVRSPMTGPRQPMGQRQPMVRQRAPMVRPRAPGMTAVRSGGGIRPRMAGPQNGVRPQQSSPVKRSPDQMQGLQAKKKRMDLLTPSDKDDDDCQVICMQPKNTDGGLPQIESVQGGQSEPAESSIMHLSDSITLSVRNPPPKPAVSPQKADAKAVANILATRGITVTATAKAKEKADSPQKNGGALPTSLSLNGAVSIVPTAKTNGNSKESLPTVDLTDDSGPANKQPTSPQKANNTRPGLPYRCDLCPAQYPNAMGLNKHRQTYHKTNGGMCELGVPLINLRQPGIMQKLAALGVQNYIPLPTAGADGMYALPVISTRSPGNVSNLGATQMLSLGPVRNIPKPQTPVTNNVQPARQLPQKT